MRASNSAAFALLAGTLCAHADTFRTLYVSASLQSGATVSGSFTIPESGFIYGESANIISSSAPGETFTFPGSIPFEHGTGALFASDVYDNFSSGFALIYNNVQIPSPLLSAIPICSLTYYCANYPDYVVYSTFTSDQGIVDPVISGTLSPTAPTPEPSSLALLATGMLGLTGLLRKQAGGPPTR